jgi:hypothetical protein
MFARRVNLKLSLVVGVLLAAGAALAQSGQSIIFTQPPDDSAGAGSADALRSAENHNLANQIQAPTPLFNFSPEPDEPFMPLPRSPLSPDEQKELQKNLEDKKNWTLLTPEEILGVKKPADLLPPDQPADDEDVNLTPMERYLKRQDQARQQAAVTNGLFGGGDDLSRWNPSRKPDETPDDGRVDNSRIDAVRAAAANASPYLRQLLINAPENNPPMGRDTAEGAARLFGFGPPPTPSPAQVQAQIAEMNRFREMLMPDTPEAKTSPGGKFLFSAQPLPEANLQSASPAKLSFNEVTPLTTVNVKVTDVSPLSSLSGQPLAKPATATRPSWAPQPPPWLSQTPQPFVAPQREF